MMGTAKSIEFEGINAPVSFTNCDDLVDMLPFVFSQWPYRQVEHSDGPTESFLTAEFADGNYRLVSPYMGEPYVQPDAVNAICTLVAELAWASLRENPEHLCVHAAAIEFAGRLVLVPNARRAGKSTLTACLAASGQAVFTDDFLSIEMSEAGHPIGLASGIAPRIRNPLPDDFSVAMKDYVALTENPTNRQYSYLDIGGETLARRGTGLAIGAIVLLQREPGVAATLLRADKAEILKAVIVQNFSRAQNAGRILQVLHFLASTVELRVLNYSRAEDAAALLTKEFAEWPADLPATGLPSASDTLATISAAGTIPARPEFQPDMSYTQSDAMVEYVVEDAHFLADSDGYAIHQLNQMSSAVWKALSEPSTMTELSDLFSEAFPDHPSKVIEADIQQLLGQFVQNRLVVPAQQHDLPAAED